MRQVDQEAVRDPRVVKVAKAAVKAQVTKAAAVKVVARAAVAKAAMNPAPPRQ